MESPHALVERALDCVRERSAGPALPAHMSVTINFHPDWTVEEQPVINRLAREGCYRSQFETGTSNGGLTAYPGGDRWLWESRIFAGVYDDAPPKLRPKYGALNDRGWTYGGSPRFGSAHFRLRAETLARTTFCFPDSHLDPADFGVTDRMDLLSKKDSEADALDHLDRYIEAQVHGPLEIASDVAALVLDPSHRGTEVEQFAEALDCPVEWHAGFRMSVDRLADCERYRGAEAAQLVEVLSEAGFLTPREIGLAQQDLRASPMALKRLWHCVARFGAPDMG